jgi:hypothetical protein
MLLIRTGCSALALTLAFATIPAPGFAQNRTDTPTTEQDHKSHHADPQSERKAPPAGDHRGMGMTDNMKSMMSMCDMMGSPDDMGKLEQRITALKAKLEITEAQELQWKRFADALRGNARTMHEVHDEMMKPGKPGSLPDSIARTRQMADTHLKSLKAIEEAVQPLYATFSTAQKQAADAIRITPMGLM